MSQSTNTLAVLHFLRDAYAHRWQPTAEQIKAWTVLLSDVPADALQRAAVQYARTHQHPPSVAELRELAAPDASVSGDEAFGWARKAARHASPYSSERCSEAWAALEKKDPVAAEACRQFGGFRAFWEMLSSDVTTERAQFRRIYESLASNAKRSLESASAQTLIERTSQTHALPAIGARTDRGDEPRRLL